MNDGIFIYRSPPDASWVRVRAVGPFVVDGIEYLPYMSTVMMVRSMISLIDDNADPDLDEAATMRCGDPMTERELRDWTAHGLLPTRGVGPGPAVAFPPA